MAVRTGPQPMPGVMPQMPGIMGAPMGPPPGMPPMGGMPGMPPMPMGGMPPPMPMPMPMGGPMGGPPPGPQGGRPASLGTLPAPSTAEQRAGFGAAVGSVMGRPVAGSMPMDVFARGIPGGMMDASIPRPVAMMAEGGSVAPRRTEIRGQDHMLAYITPGEAGILKAMGGSGEPGPMGIPSYPPSQAEIARYITNQSNPQQRAFAEELLAAGMPISLSRYGSWNDLPTSAKPHFDTSPDVANLIDWNTVMKSPDPAAAAKTAEIQIRESTLNPVNKYNIPGSLYYDTGSFPGASGDGISASITGDTSVPRAQIVSGSGYQLGNVPLKNLEAPQTREGSVRYLLDAGATLAQIQSLVPNIDLSQYAQYEVPRVEGNFVRADAAEQAARDLAAAQARQPLDNYTSAMQEAENLGVQLRMVNDPSRGGDPEYKANLLERYRQEAADLAAKTGFVVDPNTGNLVARPDVPLVSDVTYYPDVLKAMMSPATMAAYQQRFQQGPTGGTGMPSGTVAGGGAGGYGAGPVVSQPGGGITSALPGDVMSNIVAGPIAGSVYQPTVSDIPSFVSGVSDIFGVRPITYAGAPEARIESRLGTIGLPPRPESVNVFDWLQTPVAGFGGAR